MAEEINISTPENGDGAQPDTTAPKKEKRATASRSTSTRSRRTKKDTTDEATAVAVSEDQVTRNADYDRNAFMEEARANTMRRAEYNQQKEQYFAKLTRLRDLKKSRQIVSGRVIGVTPPDKGVCAIVLFEGMQVLIPYRDMFIDYQLEAAPDESAQKIARRQEQLLRKTVSADIDFVISDYFENPNDQTDMSVLGNRREALLRLQKRNYEPQGDKPAVVQEGGIYPGTIIGVGIWGVRICVLGVDTQIWAADMSYRPIENLSALYSNGQVVDVCVREISRNEAGMLTIKGNCKTPELEQYRKNINAVSVGSIMLARISRVDVSRKTGIPRATLFVDDVDVPGYTTSIKTDNMKEPLRPGSQVLFRVDGVAQNQAMVYGSIIRIL